MKLTHTTSAGELAEAPKHTPFITSRQFTEFVTITSFVRAYCKGNVVTMTALLTSDALEFSGSGVWGLANQLLEKVATRSIQRLTSTYLTISLADIARESKMVNADKAELHILKCVSFRSVGLWIGRSIGRPADFKIIRML